MERHVTVPSSDGYQPHVVNGLGNFYFHLPILITSCSHLWFMAPILDTAGVQRDIHEVRLEVILSGGERKNRREIWVA